MTLEATLALPIFFFAVFVFIAIMRMMRFSVGMQYTMASVGKEIAVYQGAAEILGDQVENEELSHDIASHALSNTAAYLKVVNTYTDYDYFYGGVIGGRMGVTNLFSSLTSDEDLIDLIFMYRLEPPGNVFSVRPLFMVERCRMKLWTGYDPKEASEDEQMVYITETGTVYHLSDTCTHLDLSIRPVFYEEINELRNMEGAIYYACEHCGEGGLNPGDLIFVTNYGTRYHCSLSCSGLKRTVEKIPLSEVGGRGCCSRCGHD